MKKIWAFVLIISFYTPLINADDSGKVFLDDMDYAYQKGRNIYSYFELKSQMDNINWDEVYKEAKSELENNPTLLNYYKVMSKLAASLHDGHVNFTPKVDYNIYYLPISFRLVDGNVIISGISRDEFYLPTAISVGDRLSSIDGKDIKEVMNDYAQYVSGSTEGMRMRGVVRRLNRHWFFLPPPVSAEKLTFVSYKTKQTFTEEVPWLVMNTSEIADDAVKPSDRAFAKILAGNIGYLKISAMMLGYDDPSSKYVDYIYNLFDGLMNTDGMIIDVRDNGGGDSEVSKAIIARLVDKKVVYNSNSPRLSDELLFVSPDMFLGFHPDPATDGKYSEWVEDVVRPAPEGMVYRKPVMVLTNSGCFSACDTFVDSFSSNNLGPVMGEPTGGGTGWPQNFSLPSDISRARFSITRGKSNKGNFIEGTGTKPDIFAALTTEDIVERRDSVLLQALERMAGHPVSVLKTMLLGTKSKVEVPLEEETSKEMIKRDRMNEEAIQYERPILSSD